MSPLNKGPHEDKHQKHKIHKGSTGKAFNTPENALKSIDTGRACINALTPGRVWTHKGPHGEIEIKGCLLLNNSAVVVLHFSPEDGSLLPKGLHGLGEKKPETISLVESKLKQIGQQLMILEGAEFREPESCWAIPLSNQGRIVGHIKVSADGSEVLADKKASDEMINTD